MAADIGAHVLPSPSVLGYVATLAALRHGAPWLAAQVEYLRGNRDLVQSTLSLPAAPVQATYLAWIDARTVKDAYELFLRHGVALSPGEQYGAPGYVRLNFGTQRARLREALQRMRRALDSAG
jgi:cystathionine beta-lyase